MEKVSLRLQWYPQTQFAGYLVAKEAGFYRDAGLDVDVRAAGPDLRPTTTVAAGSDDFGIGISNQVITARSNGVPLVIVSQVFQDSANRYVLKAESRISALTELRGRDIGLWLGGDEAEFLAMLATAGMKPTDVRIIPQEFSISPFLEGAYSVSQVTVYNELLQIYDAGIAPGQLQILAPGDYGAAIPGDMIFTTERMVQERPETVRKFVSASLRGWQAAFDNPAMAVDVALKANPELDRNQQLRQLDQVKSLVLAGQGGHQMGAMTSEMYETAKRVLSISGQLDNNVEVGGVFWEGQGK